MLLLPGCGCNYNFGKYRRIERRRHEKGYHQKLKDEELLGKFFMEMQDVSFGARQIDVARKGADHSRPNTVLRRIPFWQGSTSPTFIRCATSRCGVKKGHCSPSSIYL